MKTALLVILLSVIPAIAQTNKPVAVKATLTVTNVLRRDIFYIEDPGGQERQQQFRVVELHTVSYPFGGKTLFATNEIATDRVVMKPMIRTRTLTQGTNPPPLPGGEWTEKPK